MIQVIQTNQSLNVFGQEKDFQSFVRRYSLNKYQDYSEWDVFKDCIKLGKGIGLRKKPIEITIDDDFHLEVIYRNNGNMFTKSQFYLVHNGFKEECESEFI